MSGDPQRKHPTQRRKSSAQQLNTRSDRCLTPACVTRGWMRQKPTRCRTTILAATLNRKSHDCTACMPTSDPPRTRTWNLRLRGPTPYPLGQRAVCIPAKPRGCARRDSLPRRHVLGQMRPWGLGQNRSAPWECNLPCASSMPAGPPWRTEAPMWRRYVRPSAPAISMMPCEAAVVGHASHKPRTLAEWSEALA